MTGINDTCTENKTTVGDTMLMDIQDLMHHTEGDDSYEKDDDTCSNDDLEELFPNVYTRFQQIKIASDDSSCTNLQSDSKFNNVAVSSSDSEINIVKVDSMKVVLKYKPHKKQITSLRFSPVNDNLLYTSSVDGTIKIYDTRSNKCEKEFKDETSDELKPFTTFDVSINDRILCAGTELIDEDAFLLFWDIRGIKLLGGYWESHSDEITTIKFNDTSPDIMASGSVDGLINIFDVSKESEDDAFTYCLNSGGTVNQIAWEADDRNQKFLLSVADACKVDCWNIEESVPSKRFSQEDITRAVKRKRPEESYVVSIFNDKETDPVILVGSGMQTADSTCLRSLSYNRKAKSLQQKCRFLYESEKKPFSPIRASLYYLDLDSYFTVAEDGSFGMWSKEKIDHKKNLKISAKKSKDHRKKPY